MIPASYRSADLLGLVLARHFEKDLGASVVAIGSAPDWDIKFVDGTAIELKLDVMALASGNVAIEFWDIRRNKPTGILATKATRWIHCLPENDGLRCLELDCNRLKRLVVESGVVKKGGDDQSSLLKLLPIEKMKEISSRNFLLTDPLISVFRVW